MEDEGASVVGDEAASGVGTAGRVVAVDGGWRSGEVKLSAMEKGERGGVSAFSVYRHWLV